LDLLKKVKAGFPIPLPLDANGKPSMTLLSAYVSFIVAEISIVKCLQDDDVKVYAMFAAIGVFVFALVMMRLRRLDSAEIDFDDMSIKLNSKGKDNDTNPKPTNANRENKIV